MGDAFWAFLSLLGLSSDDIADSSDSVSWGSIHCPVPVRVSDSVLAVLFNITHCLQGILTLLGLCPTLPIFLKLPKLSPSLSRWDTTDKHRHPRQGQYTGQSIVLSLSEIFWWKVWWSQCPTSVL